MRAERVAAPDAEPAALPVASPEVDADTETEPEDSLLEEPPLGAARTPFGARRERTLAVTGNEKDGRKRVMAETWHEQRFSAIARHFFLSAVVPSCAQARASWSQPLCLSGVLDFLE